MGGDKAMNDLTVVDYAEQELLYNTFMAPALRSAVARFALAPGSHGLDVGCGPGGVLPLLDEALQGQGAIVALDISRPHLQRAQDEAGAFESATRCHLAQVDLKHPLPFADGAFDWCWTADTLNSEQANIERGAFPDPISVVRELARVTRPGGMVAAFFGNWLGAMLMPGYAHIEQCLMTALEVHYNKRGRFHPSFRHENAFGWFQAAGLTEIEVTPHTALYQAPLPDDVRRYIQRWVFEHEYRTPERIKEYALGAGLTEDEWDLWLKLSNPGAPEYILRRDDYFCIRYGILTTGRVPDGEVRA